MPGALLARNDSAFTVSTLMLSGSEGAVFSRDLEACLPIASGSKIALGAVGTVAQLAHGMIAASKISGQNENFYNRSSVTTPRDPFGSTSNSIEGHMAVWVETEANVAPNQPTVTPGDPNSGTPQLLSSQPFTITGTFSDANEAVGSFGTGNADYLRRCRYQVINPDGSLFYDSGNFNATASEQTARQFSRTYAGPTLTEGVTYKLRCYVVDHFLATSDWSDYRYFQIGGGAVNVSAGTPTGKQETINPTPFTGVWTHTSGTTANRAQIRIETAQGAILQTSAALTISVANGATISRTWAQTGLADLDWGDSLRYRMRGSTDGGSTWSSWSGARSFTINAAPTIPSSLAPSGGAVLTSRPRLTCRATDADDTVATGLVVKCRIKNSGGTVLFTRSMTFDAALYAGAGGWKYQTNATDLATFASYLWDAYSGDGTVWSGGQTVEANAIKSAEAAFTYADGPTVTVTAPTEDEVITTATPRIEWTTTGQVKYQVRIYRVSDGALVHDSGLVTSANAFYDVPGGASLTEGLYELTVAITNAAPLTGISAVRHFELDYPTPPALTGFQASAQMAPGDPNSDNASVVALTWDQTTYTDEEHDRTVLTREVSAESIAVDPSLDEGPITLAEFTSSTETSYLDATPAAGVSYVYRLWQVITQGIDSLTSEVAEQEISLTFESAIFQDAANPQTRVVFAARRERRIGINTDQEVVPLWNHEHPVIFQSNTLYEDMVAEYSLIEASNAQVNAVLVTLRELLRPRDGAPLLYRDGRGRRRWVRIVGRVEETDPEGGGIRWFRIPTVDVAHVEGL